MKLDRETHTVVALQRANSGRDFDLDICWARYDHVKHQSALWQ